MAQLPSFSRHRSENSDKKGAEGGLVIALELTIAEVVYDENELDEPMARAIQKQMERRDVLLH